jgi:hypothetical protein
MGKGKGERSCLVGGGSINVVIAYPGVKKDELLIRQVGLDWINRNRNNKSRTRCARFPSYRTTRCTCPNTLTVSSGSPGRPPAKIEDAAFAPQAFEKKFWTKNCALSGVVCAEFSYRFPEFFSIVLSSLIFLLFHVFYILW